MQSFRYKLSSLILVSAFMAPVSFATNTAAPVTRVILSPTINVTPMSIPGMTDDFSVWSAGKYAFAVDWDNFIISFFNGTQWSQAQKVTGKGGYGYFAMGYPKTGKKPDAWLLPENNNVYHFDGKKWSAPYPAAKILHITPDIESTDLETAGGYAFLVGSESNKQQNTNTLAFSVWSPKTGQWSAPTLLKGVSSDITEAFSPIAAYNTRNPSAALLTYSDLHSSKPQTHILQIESNGKYAFFTSPKLPLYKEMQGYNEYFVIDKLGAYVVLESPTHKNYLWYNHTSIAGDWHSVQLSANPVFPPGNLSVTSVHAGTVCEEINTGGTDFGINVSCIDTLSDRPRWSVPVDIAEPLGPISYYIAARKGGAWLPLISNANPTITTLPYVMRYDTSTQTVHDTNLKHIVTEPSVPVLRELSGLKVLACLSAKNDHDKLFVYDGTKPTIQVWQHLPDTRVNVHGCLISSSDQIGTDLSNDQVFWLSDANNNAPAKNGKHGQKTTVKNAYCKSS